jgi:RNA recognition motif-containing protein
MVATGDGIAADTQMPCPTLYVSNLPTSKVNLETQKKMLLMLFNHFGKVVEVRATKGRTKRGQAWVSFESQDACSAALQARQGFNFFDKPLKLSFAKATSDVLTKKDGSFVPRPQKECHVNVGSRTSRKRRKVVAGSVSTGVGVPHAGGAPGGYHAPFAGNTTGATPRGAAPAAAVVTTAVVAVPNKVLFATGLNPATTADTLTQHFSAFDGFVEVRMVPGNKGMAFVEFSNESTAKPALLESQKKSFDGHVMQLAYAKK